MSAKSPPALRGPDKAIEDSTAGEVIEPLSWADHSDTDSGYDESLLSTESVTESIFAYEKENGRSYHAYHAGKYVMPADEGEQERMDIHYHSLRLALENMHWIAPIEAPTAILDVGTGTGIWAMDVADSYPGSHVIGVDLSPIQPTLVPPNLEFQICDADESWDMDNRFDLVHTRFMNGFSIRSWEHFYQEAFKSMKPGGWVENQEFDLNFTADDGTLPADGAMIKWQTLWNDAVESVGMTARCYPDKMTQHMINAGFVNVTVRPYKLPLGPWPKNKRLRDAGTYNLVGMSDGLTGLSIRTFTQILGWSVEEMEALLMQVRSEFKNRRIHSYFPIYVVYGQKPRT